MREDVKMQRPQVSQNLHLLAVDMETLVWIPAYAAKVGEVKTVQNLCVPLAVLEKVPV